jgi:hypothetical protein
MKEYKMKFLILTLGFIAISTTAFAAPNRNIIAKDFQSTCRFEHPLDTYDGCNKNSHAGETAFECAKDDAMADCRNEYFSDCIVVGARYKTIISREFFGYKACEVTVLMRGYRATN